MTYAKPTITVLGDAVSLIQASKPITMGSDQERPEVGAYDTEE